MMHRRGVIPVLVLLVLVVAGTVMQIVGGPAATPPGVGSASHARAATPTPPAGRAREVVRSLAAVQRAFNAGDVRLLCRPGGLVDPAVIRQQNALPGGCESELEALMANQPRLRLTVRRVAMRRDLATAAVTTAGGGSLSLDLVRQGRRWLVSFRDGAADPMPALARAA
jgi:hypothetical protein